MKELHILTEEESAKEALDPLVAGVVSLISSERVTIKWRPHDGLQDLLSKAPGYLKSLRNNLDANWARAIVLIDSNSVGREERKRKIEAMVEKSGLITKSKAGADCGFHVITRIVVQELESWYLGDEKALASALGKDYPTSWIQRHVSGRDIETIGKPSRGLARALAERRSSREQWTSPGTGGSYKLIKTNLARAIAPHLAAGYAAKRNTSRSFGAFCCALETAIRSLSPPP